MDIWYLYIAECNDKSFYTGISNNVEYRVSKHNSGKGTAYTATRVPVHLIYKEKVGSYSDALIREAQIKKWSRIKKENLVKYGNPYGPPES